jgi:hypothetical protein
LDAAKTRLKKAKAAETKSSVSSVCLFVSNRQPFQLRNFKDCEVFYWYTMQNADYRTVWQAGHISIMKHIGQN